ncbi:MAG: DUF3658 domain-containing protein [Oscillospiraceae bacterium]
MLDIVFGDSACGSLKMAQRYGEGAFHAGGIGVIVTHHDGSEPSAKEIAEAQKEAVERQRLAWERGKPLGGNPGDVFGFNLALSVGDISEATPGPRRLRVMEWLYSIYPDDEADEATGSWLPKEIQRCQDTLQTLRARATQGEALRLWVSDKPDDLCGLYWFMAQAENWGEARISLVRLPPWEAAEDGHIVQRAGWGEVAPGEWHRYLPLETPAPPLFRQFCAEQWRALQKENAPLRAVLNGRLVSAPATLYDSFIEREIAAEGEVFHEAMVVGRVLGNYQLGIGDAWVALRIEEMIGRGVLQPVDAVPKDKPLYHRRLKKSGQAPAAPL